VATPCDIQNAINTNAGILADALLFAFIPQNGVLRLVSMDGSTVDVPIPYFADTIISGLAVTQPDPALDRLTFDIALGVAQINGVLYNVSAATFTLPDGDSTFDRVDIIFVNSSGVLATLQGTPSANPVPPSPPLNSIVLATVGVGQNATATTGTVTLTPVNLAGTPQSLPAGITDKGYLIWNASLNAWVPQPFLGVFFDTGTVNIIGDVIGHVLLQDGITGARSAYEIIQSTGASYIANAMTGELNIESELGTQVVHLRGIRPTDFLTATQIGPFPSLFSFEDESSNNIAVRVGYTALSAPGIILYDDVNYTAGNGHIRVIDEASDAVGTTRQILPLRITLADGANINWNVRNGDYAFVEIAGNRILNTLTGVFEGETYVLFVKQGAGGNHTMTWPANVSWPSATGAPVLSTAAGRTDMITFFAMNGRLVGNFQLGYTGL
jgi:hypothetical protein